MAKPILYEANKVLYGNFLHKEVAKSQDATDLHIDNTPSPMSLVRAEYTAKTICQPIRDHFGIGYSPTSWYRCEKLERAINYGYFKLTWCPKYGLEPNEDNWKIYFERKSHPLGGTCDIKLRGIPNKELYQWIKDNLQYDQLILEFPDKLNPFRGWVHVSRNMPDRMQDFIIGAK